MKYLLLIFVLFALILSNCSQNIMFETGYVKRNPSGYMEGGYASFTPKQAEMYNYTIMTQRKQYLGQKRYSITDISKISKDKYVLFGTDRDYFNVGNFYYSKEQLDYLLKYETEDTNYTTFGW